MKEEIQKYPYTNPKDKKGRRKLTPRERRAISLWKQPKSKTFGNLYRSLLAAGYSPSYARTIYSRGLHWLECKREEKLVELAENAVEDLIAPGSKHIREKADLSKFVLARLSPKYKEKIDNNINGNITIQRMSFTELPSILPQSEEKRDEAESPV